MGAATLIIQGLLAALSAAPQATELVKQIKTLFGTFQKNKIITKAEQEQLVNFCNDAQEKALAGEELPSWTVEQDPNA